MITVVTGGLVVYISSKIVDPLLSVTFFQAPAWAHYGLQMFRHQ
jgi:hypothetical protein